MSPENRTLVERVAPSRSEQSIARLYPELLGRLLDAVRAEERARIASSFADALAKLPPRPWRVWTSCSYRRIGGATGNDGDVLHAYNQRSDGHPDLSMPEDQLQALVNIVHAAAHLTANRGEA